MSFMSLGSFAEISSFINFFLIKPFFTAHPIREILLMIFKSVVYGFLNWKSFDDFNQKCLKKHPR